MRSPHLIDPVEHPLTRLYASAMPREQDRVLIMNRDRYVERVPGYHDVRDSFIARYRVQRDMRFYESPMLLGGKLGVDLGVPAKPFYPRRQFWQ